MKNNFITQSELKDLIEYDPNTGIFIWNKSRAGVRKGDIAGTKRPDGYYYIGLNRVRYYAHRLAWLYVHGAFPTGDIDHINGNPSDNRLSNLREVTRQQNLFNMRKKKNVSNVKGVTLCKKTNKWTIVFRVNGVATYFGHYDNIEDAEKVVRAKREEFHGVFANHG